MHLRPRLSIAARVLLRLAVLVPALAWSLAPAAGFDCAKASTATDKAICASPRLDQLDTRLSQAYAQARHACPGKALTDAQRRWLREERNRCADEACLVAAYEARLARLSRPDCADPTQTCTASPAWLVGAWRLASEGGPFEEMAFSADAGFRSWLHQRPERFGARWRLEGCALRIQDADGGPASRYTVLKLEAKRLTLREEGEADTAVYRRIPGAPPP